MRILSLLFLVGCPFDPTARLEAETDDVVAYLVEANCVSWHPCTLTYTSPDQDMWAGKLMVANSDGDQRMLDSKNVLSVAIEFDCQNEECTIVHSATGSLLRTIEIRQNENARQIVTNVHAVSMPPP